ncbi:hypothetical protein Cha6605_0271 [Chamaesiphon minutus PCC 6605]|uniref:Uncharacterized protein n=1 Tax=Chamaesiphon minutus (strain ATCC 27169 / PCC 6605) TaxID=1173020 RepID=K9U900_CHAP6|nr:hypothetical protein Cha6605_0271 [Chamaesiphon minutus PCC 6605]
MVVVACQSSDYYHAGILIDRNSFRFRQQCHQGGIGSCILCVNKYSYLAVFQITSPELYLDYLLGSILLRMKRSPRFTVSTITEKSCISLN